MNFYCFLVLISNGFSSGHQPDFYLIGRLLDQREINDHIFEEPKTNRCDECDRWTIKRCNKCEILLCDLCFEASHMKFKFLKDHKLIDCSSPQHDQENRCPAEVCCLHSNSHAVYCESCNEFICEQCYSNHSKLHVVVPVHNEVRQ